MVVLHNKENSTEFACDLEKTYHHHEQDRDYTTTGMPGIHTNTFTAMPRQQQDLQVVAPRRNHKGHLDNDNDNELHRSRSENGSGASTNNDDEVDDDANKAKKDKKKVVTFTKITIREYPIIVGCDHPSDGPPLTICWNHLSSLEVDLDSYEMARNNESYRRRNKSEMRIPQEIRIQMLQGLGFTTRQIQEGTKSATALQKQRLKSIANMKSDTLIESYEAFRRSLGNAVVTFLGRKKRKGQSYLRRCCSSRSSSSKYNNYCYDGGGVGGENARSSCIRRQ